jgi:hypothetical protein
MGLPFQDALNNFLGYDPNDPSSAGFGGWPPRLPYQDLARQGWGNAAGTLAQNRTWSDLQGFASAPDVPPLGMAQPSAYDPATLMRLLAATGNQSGLPFAGDDPAGGFVGADQYQHGYTSTRPNWHYYTAGPNLVCPAEWACRREDLLAPFTNTSIPGLDPGIVPQSGHSYPVHDPWFGSYPGDVRTEISPDGTTITNTTLQGHDFFDGQVVRRLRQAPDGSWYVTTLGFGNNIDPRKRMENEVGGPLVFSRQDASLRETLRRPYGR